MKIEINKKLASKKIEYSFYFLTPKDYTSFFEKVIKKDRSFVGEMHADLLKRSREELK